MSLQIECENGHKLICPDALAGSSVICPKCGSRVDVSARNVAKGGRAVSAAAVASISDLNKNVAVVTAPAPSADGSKADIISFSCPVGHKLTGPRTLQGQAGECPKCKVKFRVPIVEWQTTSSGRSQEPVSDADDQAAQDTAIGIAAPLALTACPPPEDDDDISLEGLEEIDVPTVLAPRRASATGADAFPHPLEQLFTKLWREREHGGVVELHLDNGGRVAPDWWSAAHSSRSYGLFATQNDSGTYEIHAIAWPHVRRITVTGLTELPGGVFEGT
jgi:hypothetical protein